MPDGTRSNMILSIKPKRFRATCRFWSLILERVSLVTSTSHITTKGQSYGDLPLQLSLGRKQPCFATLELGRRPFSSCSLGWLMLRVNRSLSMAKMYALSTSKAPETHLGWFLKDQLCSIWASRKLSAMVNPMHQCMVLNRLTRQQWSSIQSCQWLIATTHRLAIKAVGFLLQNLVLARTLLREPNILQCGNCFRCQKIVFHHLEEQWVLDSSTARVRIQHTTSLKQER